MRLLEGSFTLYTSLSVRVMSRTCGAGAELLQNRRDLTTK